MSFFPTSDLSLVMVTNDSSQPELLATTYHSRIEKVSCHGRLAVRKTAKTRTSRTIAQWQNELRAMKAIAERAGYLTEFMSLLLDANEEALSITMRLEPGRSLDQWIDDKRLCRLELEDVSQIQSEMGSALNFLHDAGILHDDVKPDNIVWVAEDKRAVLIDFGAAIQTVLGEIIVFNPSGTPPYAPPEYLKKQKGMPGDMWALGVTLLFAKRHVKLPDGNWILPYTFEQAEPRKEMQEWLAEVEANRKVLLSEDPVLAGLLHPDPEQRLTAKDLVHGTEIASS